MEKRYTPTQYGGPPQEWIDENFEAFGPEPSWEESQYIFAMWRRYMAAHSIAETTDEEIQ